MGVRRRWCHLAQRGQSGVSAVSHVEGAECSGGGRCAMEGAAVVMRFRRGAVMIIPAQVCGRAGVSGVVARPRVGLADRCGREDVSPRTTLLSTLQTVQARTPPSRPVMPTLALVRKAGVCGHCGQNAAAVRNVFGFVTVYRISPASVAV